MSVVRIVLMVGAIGLGVEVSDNARFTALQTSGGTLGTTRSERRHSDLIVSGLIHFRQPLGAYVGLDVLGGPALFTKIRCPEARRGHR